MSLADNWMMIYKLFNKEHTNMLIFLECFFKNISISKNICRARADVTTEKCEKLLI